MITHRHIRHTPHSVELLWTSDRSLRRDLFLTTRNTHKRQTSMPPWGGIRTRIPRKRAAAYTRLRSRGHWGRRSKEQCCQMTHFEISSSMFHDSQIRFKQVYIIRPIKKNALCRGKCLCCSIRPYTI